jgi:hypothetical protein
MIRCESHVNTRLRCVHRLMPNSGSQKLVVITELSISQRTYVVNANINLNALNGVYRTSDSESGVDSLLDNEKVFVVNKT